MALEVACLLLFLSIRTNIFSSFLSSHHFLITLHTYYMCPSRPSRIYLHVKNEKDIFLVCFFYSMDGWTQQHNFFFSSLSVVFNSELNQNKIKENVNESGARASTFNKILFESMFFNYNINGSMLIIVIKIRIFIVNEPVYRNRYYYIS